MAAPPILVVDDDVGVLTSVCRVLRSEGFEVVGARDVRAALAALECRSPPLVLLDLCLPGASGMEVLRRARGRETAVRVVAMTAAQVPDEAVFDGVLLKPFDLDDLLDFARQFATRRQPSDRG